MHMLRLLLAGAHVLRTGDVLVDVSDHRDRLLAVRAGDEPWTGWAQTLLTDLAAAAAESRLPPAPDRAMIDELLIGVRRRGLP
jgi:hypothetical protein